MSLLPLSLKTKERAIRGIIEPASLDAVKEVSPTTDIERRTNTERTMVRVRWAGVVFGLIQVLTFYRPYPKGILPLALSLVGVLALGNVIIWLAVRASKNKASIVQTSLVAMLLDFIVVMGFVWVYTFDAETAIWALIYILPLEGALRFQLKGSFWVMVGATAAYVIREFYGAQVFGNEFLPTSISFRMGIGFIIASVAGASSSSLLSQGREIALRADQLERSELELEQANLELEEVNRSLKDFVSIASHDIRTPLTVISGFGKLLVRKWDSFDDEQKKDFVHSIDRQSDYLMRLADDLLTTSRIEAGVIDVQGEVVNIGNIVDEAIEHYAGTNVEVDVPFDALALADPSHVTRIISNYLGNSIKYGEAPYRVVASTVGEWVIVAVEDQGAGVSDEFVDRLFEKFARADEAKQSGEKGTGLGLSIVRGLAEVNGGEVWYERGPSGKGSRFCLRLPRANVAGG